MDVELELLSPTTRVTSNSDEEDLASRATHSTNTPPPRAAIQTADPSTTIPLADNPHSEQRPGLIEPGHFGNAVTFVSRGSTNCRLDTRHT